MNEAPGDAFATADEHEDFRAILRCVAEGVIYLDARGHVRWMNPSAQRILGRTAIDFSDPSVDLRSKMRRADGTLLPLSELPGLQSLRTGQSTRETEIGLPRPDGDLVWCDVSAEPVRRGDGAAVTGAVVSFLDVSDRRRAQAVARARDSVLEFAASHDTGAILTFVLDQAETVTESSIGFFHFMEAPEGTLWLQAWSTRTARDFCRAEGAGTHYPLEQAGVWADCVRQGRAVVYNDYKALAHARGLPDGHAEVDRFVSIPIIRGTEVVAIIGVGNKPRDYTDSDVQAVMQLADLTWDIVTSRRSLEAMRLNEARRQTVIQTAMDGFWMIDLEGHLTEVNDTYCRMSGYSRDELLQMSVSDLEAEMTQADVKARTAHIIEAGEDRFESGHRRKDGSTFPVEVSVQYKASGGGALVAFLRDISERQRLQGQLLQSQRVEAVGRLAGGVAHDFNNMLGVIVGRAEMVLERIGQAHALTSDLTEILTAARRSSDLTQQLLAFARRQPVAPTVLDVNDTVSSMLKMLGRLIGERIELVWKPGAKLPPIKIDRSQLDQVLANLCVNARDAIDGVGTVTIETDHIVLDDTYCDAHADCTPGDYVLLVVRDTGCGMNQETLGHLFDPFFTTKGMGKGTGLGLATVYGIVKQNGGTISVSSTVGVGTVFSIFLPRHHGRVDRPTHLHIVHPTPSGRETILLVEDEPSLLELTATVLGDLGYSVLSAAKPSQAMRLARDHADEIDLLVTDIIMPEMNGRELANLVHEQFPEIKCLFMSGYSDEPIVQDSAVSDGVHFIQKPWSRQAFAAKVRAVLDHRPSRSR